MLKLVEICVKILMILMNNILKTMKALLISLQRCLSYSEEIKYNIKTTVAIIE